jgi:hypothetical protein
MDAPYLITFDPVTLVVDSACLGLPSAAISLTLVPRLLRSLTPLAFTHSFKAVTKEMRFCAFTLPRRARPRSGRVRRGLRYANRPKCVRLQRQPNDDWQNRKESANSEPTRYQW